jgi:hypothetical protein
MAKPSTFPPSGDAVGTVAVESVPVSKPEVAHARAPLVMHPTDMADSQR